MTSFSDRLALQREELVCSWCWRLARSSNGLAKPWAQVTRIFEASQGMPLSDKALDSQLRQFHNLLGYRAWGSSAHTGGFCGGTIFRTTGFILLEQRRFRKRPIGTKTIHIEHTYPIAMLRAEIRKARFSSPPETLKWLLRHSIATAMMESEQHLIGAKYRKWSGALIASDTTEFQRPFMRYEHISQNVGSVWNVLAETEVDRSSFSFDDHLMTICKLLREVGADVDLLSALEA